jgi:hypothetical protein
VAARAVRGGGVLRPVWVRFARVGKRAVSGMREGDVNAEFRRLKRRKPTELGVPWAS